MAYPSCGRRPFAPIGHERRLDDAAKARRATLALGTALVVIALLVRLAFILETRTAPCIRTPAAETDIALFWEGATGLANGTTPNFAAATLLGVSRAHGHCSPCGEVG